MTDVASPNSEFTYECLSCGHKWLAPSTGLGAVLDLLDATCPACGRDTHILAAPIRMDQQRS